MKMEWLADNLITSGKKLHKLEALRNNVEGQQFFKSGI